MEGRIGGIKGHEPSVLNTKSGVRYPGVRGQELSGCEVRENEPRESETRVHREAKGLEAWGWGSIQNPRR